MTVFVRKFTGQIGRALVVMGLAEFLTFLVAGIVVMCMGRADEPVGAWGYVPAVGFITSFTGGIALGAPHALAGFKNLVRWIKNGGDG